MKTDINEGIKADGTPDMKYYAFDWDDNVVHMPTKIILKDSEGDEVSMSTEDFSKYRDIIGKKDFKYKGDIVVGFGKDPFRNFREDGDKDFVIDSMRAKKGPSFNDFKEAINSGSIFSIITARGHSPSTLKQVVYNYIISGFNGIDKDMLLKNLKKYRSFYDENDMSDGELIKSYLDLNKFYPVSFRDETVSVSPEDSKVIAMHEFVSYVEEMAHSLNKRAFLKNDVLNNFNPVKHSIGFSDDDIKNIEVMNKSFKNKPNNIVKIYSTSAGSKKEYVKD